MTALQASAPGTATPRIVIFCFILCSLRTFSANCESRVTRDCRPEVITPYRDDIPLCGNIDLTTRSVVHIFAQIGDYGDGSPCEQRVAELMNVVARMHNKAYRGQPDNPDVDFIFTTGDNAYGGGSFNDIIANLNPVYERYIKHGLLWTWPKDGTSGSFPANHPDAMNHPYRFFPCIGNHDEIYLQLTVDYGRDYLPYLQYFDYLKTFPPGSAASLPGQWYTHQISPHLALFAMNSNRLDKEPWRDEQISWLQEALRTSEATFNIVFFHTNPVGSATHHYPDTSLRFPYSEWGVSALFSGHVHIYERFECCDDGSAPPCQSGQPLPYIVNGMSGNPPDAVYQSEGCPLAPGSQAQYVDTHGFVLGVLHVPKGMESQPTFDAAIDWCLYSIDKHGTRNDSWTMRAHTRAPTRSPTTAAPTLAPPNVELLAVAGGLSFSLGFLCMCCVHWGCRYYSANTRYRSLTRQYEDGNQVGMGMGEEDVQLGNLYSPSSPK